MSTTVSTGNVTMTSTSATAEELVKTLSDEKEEKPKPKVLVDKGVSVEEEPEKEGLSKAASEMGKEGAKAAAKARKEAKKYGGKTVEEMKAVHEAAKAKLEAEEPDEEEDEAEAARKEASEEIESEPDRDKRKQLASERVREATQKAAAERRRADKLESELQALRNAPRQASEGQPEARRTEAPQPTEGKERPQEGDYEHYSEYVEALTDWKTDQKFAKVKEEQAREQFAHTYANDQLRAIDTFRSKVAEVIKADPDMAEQVIPFKEVVQNSSHGVPPGGAHTAFNVVNDEILRSNVPAQLMAYLNGNEDVMRELLSLPNRDAIARKMERIQSKIEAELEDAPTGTPSPARAVSKAPPPFQPVKGTPRTATGDLTDKSPLSDFVRSHGESLMRTRAR